MVCLFVLKLLVFILVIDLTHKADGLLKLLGSFFLKTQDYQACRVWGYRQDSSANIPPMSKTHRAGELCSN